MNLDPFRSARASAARRTSSLLRASACLALAVLAAPSARALERMEAWPAKRPTPALGLTDLTGHTWQLDELRGKVVLLHFWATWCESCMAELPHLNALAAEGAKDSTVVLSVNYKDAAATLAEFTAAHPAPYPVLRDRDGEAFKRFGGVVLPATILIDRSGRARWRLSGPLDAAGPAFTTALARLTAEAAPH